MKLNSKKLKVRELWPDDPAYHGLKESIPGSNSIGRPLLYCSDCDRMVNFYSQIIPNNFAVTERQSTKYSTETAANLHIALQQFCALLNQPAINHPTDSLELQVFSATHYQ